MKNAEGKHFNSSFRMKRYDKAHADEGPRAEAHEINQPEEERMEEEVHPGIHDEVKQMAAEHGPAQEVHITHDHEGGMHHVHSVHADGMEHHSDHASADEAHMHAAHAAGIQMDGMEEEKEPRMKEHKPKHEKEPEPEEDYEAEPLD